MKRGQDSRSLGSLSSGSLRSNSSVRDDASRPQTKHREHIRPDLRSPCLCPTLCCVVWQASISSLDSAHTSASVPGSKSFGKRVVARVTRQQAARQRELEVCLLQSLPSSDDESDDELETFDLEPAATCPANYRREIHAHLRELEREGAVLEHGQSPR